MYMITKHILYTINKQHSTAFFMSLFFLLLQKVKSSKLQPSLVASLALVASSSLPIHKVDHNSRITITMHTTGIIMAILILIVLQTAEMTYQRRMEVATRLDRVRNVDMRQVLKPEKAMEKV